MQFLCAILLISMAPTVVHSTGLLSKSAKISVHLRPFEPFTIVHTDQRNETESLNGIEILLLSAVANKLDLNVEYSTDASLDSMNGNMKKE